MDDSTVLDTSDRALIRYARIVMADLARINEWQHALLIAMRDLDLRAGNPAWLEHEFEAMASATLAWGHRFDQVALRVALHTNTSAEPLGRVAALGVVS